MRTDTTEAALEASVERFLTGDVSTPASNDGKVHEGPITYQAGKSGGYLRGNSSEDNARFRSHCLRNWRPAQKAIQCLRSLL